MKYNLSEIMKEAYKIEKRMIEKKYTIAIYDSYKARALREAWAIAKSTIALAFSWKNVNGEFVKIDVPCKYSVA